MNGRIVFLLEEPSMKVLLENLLPRLFPGIRAQQHFLCIPHEGKNDLDKSIPRKLAAWHTPGDKFMILRDNDNADCVVLKTRYQNMCQYSNRPDTLIRLVCQELESWYLGDLQALVQAFPQASIPSKAKKRIGNPDTWQKPSVEISRLVPEFQKISGARKMAQHLDKAENTSASYRVFMRAIQCLFTKMGYQENTN